MKKKDSVQRPIAHYYKHYDSVGRVVGYRTSVQDPHYIPKALFEENIQKANQILITNSESDNIVEVWAEDKRQMKLF